MISLLSYEVVFISYINYLILSLSHPSSSLKILSFIITIIYSYYYYYLVYLYYYFINFFYYLFFVLIHSYIYYYYLLLIYYCLLIDYYWLFWFNCIINSNSLNNCLAPHSIISTHAPFYSFINNSIHSYSSRSFYLYTLYTFLL